MCVMSDSMNFIRSEGKCSVAVRLVRLAAAVSLLVFVYSLISWSRGAARDRVSSSFISFNGGNCKSGGV